MSIKFPSKIFAIDENINATGAKILQLHWGEADATKEEINKFVKKRMCGGGRLKIC